MTPRQVGSPTPARRRSLGARGWLLVWTAAACLLFLVAPPPPEPPPPTSEELAASARATALILRDIEQWYADHGDHRIPWNEARGHLALVIDDVGRELHIFDQLLSLRFPLTFSVLPGAIYAAGVQLRLRADARRPREIMLHLPMEPLDASMMERGDETREVFLRVEDSAEVLVAKLEDALRRVPAATGINNHMGSRLTSDRAAMEAIMQPIAARGLLFLDSRTTAETVAEPIARASGVRTAARQVFLDDDPSESAIEAALAEAARQSFERPTIAIGHPSAPLLAVLRRELPRLHASGIGVYPLSELVTRSDLSTGTP